ncbi:MAG TPA: hypothetical protein VEJ39_02705 [Candidatus Acidoferrales bacterium]|nr:hypothetical protein [Candidatus Acidoferrales bacterium]
MARGWDSKGVSDQIESDAVKTTARNSKRLSLEQASAVREMKILELSRARVTRDLENSQDPRYRSLLIRALEDLDAKLAELEKAG